MSNVATGAGKERSVIFETVLSAPGMNEKCKIQLTVSRQNIILLCRLIEAGIMKDKSDFDDEIIAVLSGPSLDEMKAIHEEILKRGDLVEFYQKLKLL